MCGITGCVGSRNCVPIMMGALERLAYRGYDSAGVAVCTNGRIDLRREHGKIENLQALLQRSPISGCTGIGHTRWATHGKPSESNAHPQQYKNIAIVHNGIIENFMSLRSELESKGHVFSSETDTEIVAHLIADAYEQTHDLSKSVRMALSQVRGSYGLVAICADEPDELVAARQQSPLLVGVGQNENFVSSDISAILSHTRDFIFLEDGDFVRLTANSVELFDASGKTIQRPQKHIQWDISAAEKQGYAHYMLKEIYEQPSKITDTFRGRLMSESSKINIDEEVDKLSLENADRIHIVACGTSYHAGLLGKYMIEKYARIPVEVDVASEYRYRNPILNDKCGFIAISQSGETADTYACVKLAKKSNARVLAICNVIDSSIARASDAAFYTRADPEIGVASTKAFTTQLASLTLLALHLASKRKTMEPERARKCIDDLRQVPANMEKLLEQSDSIRKTAQSLLRANSFLYLGRNVHYPIAMEGALKLKEITYIHAESYPSGEMKHGPIALIDDRLPVIVIAPKNDTYEKTLSNLQEVRARGGRIISVVTEGDEALTKLSVAAFTIPECDEFVQPLYSVIPLQLLAYHLADLLGHDVDHPRNLAKSVTVE